MFDLMDEKLIQRLESAVARLELLSAGGSSGGGDGAAAAMDPSVIAFEEFMEQYVGRVMSGAKKIGGQVEDVTKVLEQAFSVQKELLIRIKQSQVIFISICCFLCVCICLFELSYVCVCMYVY